MSTRLLPILAAGCLVSAMSMRVVEPVVPQIARDFGVSSDLIALTTTAFAIPYALGQLILGPYGDAAGKAKVIKWALAVLALCLGISAFAESAGQLFLARICAGLAGGGVIPLAFAMIGDRVPLEQRQVAMSRVLSAIILGQVLGATGSGVVASDYGWRVVMMISFGLTAGALALMTWQLKPDAAFERKHISVESLKGSYAAVFRNPRAAICFTAVFIEGVAIFGLLPYLAILLEQRGAGGIREAGFVLAGLAVGGLMYTTFVPLMLRYLGFYNLIKVGGVIMGLGMAGIATAMTWPAEMAAFVVIGLGFYMVHNSLQTQATELAPGNRGAAVALHAFSFFAGQAVGPVVYGISLGFIGPGATIGFAALICGILGLAVAKGLEDRPMAVETRT